jgi:hypothetical protein
VSRPSEWFRAPKTPWTIPLIALVVLLVVVIGGTIAALAFAGCAAQPGGQGTYEQPDSGTVRQGSTSGDFTAHTVTLSDGRSVTCLTWSSWDLINDVMKSGMDCLEPEAE